MRPSESARRETARIIAARRGDTAPPARASHFPRMWPRFNYREPWKPKPGRIN
jgi:hypothetical protein